MILNKPRGWTSLGPSGYCRAPGGQAAWGGPEAWAVGTDPAVAPMAPHCASRLMRENRMCRSGCLPGRGRRRRRGQLCPPRSWYVSLEHRSEFSGQLEADWKRADPGPDPAPLPLFLPQTSPPRPKEHGEAIRTDKGSLSVLLTNAGEM